MVIDAFMQLALRLGHGFELNPAEDCSEEVFHFVEFVADKFVALAESIAFLEC